MLGIDVIQCMITYYLHYVTMGLLNSGAGCQCNAMLQWLCIFAFVLIVWQEISQTLDTLEFALTQEIADEDEGAETCSLDTEDASSEHDWSLCAGAEAECCPDGWSCCSESAAFCANEEALFERQFSGFRIGAVTSLCKFAVIFFTALPKLVIEGALLYVGSMYIATSRDNEEVITSVVAVTFICTLDDQLVHSLMPGNIPDGLHHTFVLWRPKSRLAWFWIRMRTDWRMFFDATTVVLTSVVMFHLAAFHARCEDSMLSLP